MTASRVAESFPTGGDAGPTPLGVYGAGFGIASGLCGLVALVSMPFAIGDDGGAAAILLTVAALGLGYAALQAQRPFDARSMRPVPTLTAGVVCYLFVAAVSTVVYLATGSIERIDDAFYESATGVATSSLTLLDDPQVLGRGLLVWRSGTQWIGGLAALSIAIGLYPFLGGSRELADPRSSGDRRLALATKPVLALKRVTVMYGGVTLAVAVAFFVLGMSVVDAVAHSFSTVSTGGFSTHADSIAHFDSTAIEIATIVAMAGAGFSLALVWMLARGLFQDSLRVFELRVYAVVLVIASAWVWWLVDQGDEAAVDGMVDAVFTVVSLSTTTGHRIADWGSWHPGAEMMLLLLIVVGGMSGSVAGGLRWIRVVGLAEFVWRELLRQLHPRTVRSVKVGSASISEASVNRWHAQLVFTMVLGGAGAVALAFFGSDVLEALTLAISAVATAGPALAEEGGTLVTASSLSRSDRATLVPLMIAGRVAIVPALVAIGVVAFRVRGWFSTQKHRHGRRGRS